MNKLKLIAAEDAADLARRAAEYFAERARDAADRFVVALSGGSTPRRFHGHLAAHMADTVPWSKVHLLLSDERALPPTDDNSNFSMVQQTLVAPLSLPEAQVHRPLSESEDLANAATGYERDLLKLTTPPGAVDLVVLGMGDDGHTASLFPGQPEPDGLIAAARATAGTVADGRITFTFQALEKAHMVMILVSGAKKAERLREVLNEQGDLPMQRVLRSRKGKTVLIADRDALARIEATQIEALS